MQLTFVNIHIAQRNVRMSANLSLKILCLHTLSAFADVLCRHKKKGYIMNLIIKTDGITPCIPTEFTINGKKAYAADFGKFKKSKSQSGNCKQHKFIADAIPNKELLYTYGITHDDYNNICNELIEKLSVDTLCKNCKKG